MDIVWSAVTCHRFGLRRPDAAVFAWIPLIGGRDRSRPTKALTPGSHAGSPSGVVVRSAHSKELPLDPKLLGLSDHMQPERWKQIDQLFHSALEQEPDRRVAFLLQECGGDESLRREVEALIASHERAEGFIETPASDLAAELFAKG